MIHQDQRGLALALVSFVALVVVAGLLFALLNAPVTDVSSQATSQNNDPVVQNQVDQAMQIWGLILYFIVFLGLVALIVRATNESRGPQ